MTRFDVTLQDRSIETIDGATAYAQEGPMTTFFRTDDDRAVVDAWSVRVASLRTAEIYMIRRSDEPDVARRAHPARLEAVGA